MHPRRDIASSEQSAKIADKIADVRKRPTRGVGCLAKARPLRTVMLPSAVIAVRGKSVGKQDRRDAQRAQDQLRKNNDAVLGNIKKSELFYVAGFQTKILALGVSGL